MTKYGLRTRVSVLTIAPTLIVGLLLSAFFTSTRYQDLEQQLTVTGSAIIEPLAIASEVGLKNDSRENVRRLIGFAHRQHSQFVRSIAVFDRRNELFVTSNYHRDLAMLSVDSGQPIPTQLQISQQQDTLILRAPILEIGRFTPGLNVERPLGYIAMELDLSSVRLKQYQEMITALVMVALGGILSCFFAYRLIADVTHPIGNMVTLVDRIRRGHLDVRIEGELLGELDTLKNGINAMAISLSEYHLEMQQSIDQATCDLRETLEQLEIQNVELDIAKKNAQEAARVKSEFLANMSHELRTPLNGVIGFTRQMLKTELSSSQRDYLLTIEKSANNLLTIINDILDFSKLEAGKLLLENIPFDVQDMLDEVMRLLAPMAHEKGLELTLRTDARIPTGAVGDPLRIQQVLINLIGNAAKFTERGNIDVSVDLKQLHDETVELQLMVKDTGIGISERQQAQLFQAFRQADASISRRYGGTGLGLVITQKLVQQMGGDIGFTSRLHQGSSFWFTLQLTQTDLPVSQPLDIEPLVGRDIVIVEPNARTREILRKRLTQVGLNVDTASGTNVLTDRHYHFALLCFDAGSMPDLDAMQQAVQVCEQQAQSVVVCLPTTELEASEHLLKAGVSACIAKPIPQRKLLEALIGSPDATPLPLPKPSASQKAPYTVMTVDDNPANLKLITALLAERVEKVITAEDGVKAVALAHQQAFDIILMDIQMPEMDGVTASQEIRKAGFNQQTPIIAVTAHAMPGERERLLEAGMDDYLTKPIEEAMLESTLARWLHLDDAASQAQSVPSPSPSASQDQSARHLDWQRALHQAAGKTDLAKEMLAMLLASFESVNEAVEQALAGELETDPLWHAIHKLHGSCAYSGVPQLKSLCHELETQLKAGADIATIEPELLELQDEIAHIEQLAPQYLDASQND
ncbi:two-component sensor histidine kinase BarA [Salinivibrio kushneri]|uniref:two-component sensor histidine kinase BarA n=1 Tax=Salinivibrio TaxID=51366 RepID=UPI000847DB25|nr:MULTISPECIES: two-component sensor histidine kinase BarA [Salinivibrio]ODP95747.1 two-component sensor histidine kinase BarA [Salinivibrio sp. BNH]OOE35283.1 two-component sensor histidine kinase BarA [Salinivibrio kushneri]OOE36342.1 two-component sensor histidine kinase BarA [Salinivibrio kushneri]OOE50975.1 two-component sensor histidine kinase BarA [Salinivibrio kushneri]OOE62485.1 two-component sensor histidine kinase BarA [Salinivibrio kushneri]